MKTKFATIDLCAVLHDLRALQGMRVVNVYDIDSKTYLIKLQKPGDKAFILFESGIRIHQTRHDWPKSQIPSGFSMKFRKHINQRRFTGVSQVGTDRIVDLQFGDGEHACHVIVELYDKGNVVLTDADYVILNILRKRTDHDHDVRFSVKERYPTELARQEYFIPSMDTIKLFLEGSKPDAVLRKELVKHVPFSAALLEHALVSCGLESNVKVQAMASDPSGAEKIAQVFETANTVMKTIIEKPSQGFLTYKEHQRPDGSTFDSAEEYHPWHFAQFSQPEGKLRVETFSSFSESVDKFYSLINVNKEQQRSLQVEREAAKKLDNVRRDHEHRLKALEEVQEIQEKRAELVALNKELVDQALLLIRSALANKMTWDEIGAWLDQARERGILAAKAIVKLDLDSNSMTMRLANPYDEDDHVLNVDIDIAQSAAQNSGKYFTDRRNAAAKQQKTQLATKKALKSAQAVAKSKVDQVRTRTNLARTRKTMWFEKFNWFVSSDGYLVIGGRDFQQNELLVKRYLRPGDLYVHADIHGACSVVIRNKSAAQQVPPRTLNEAGTMAVCYSSAWEAKIVVSAWWVRHDQVSRTAQTGEYLPAGSFMIRGKKNFLPSCQLQLGFGLLFKLDDESAARHRAMSIKSGEESEAGDGTVPPSVDGDDATTLQDDDGEDQQLSEGSDAEEQEPNDGEEDEDEFPDVEVKLTSDSVTTKTDTGEEFTLVKLASAPPANNRKKQEDKNKPVGGGPLPKPDEQEKKAKKGPMTKRQKHKADKIKKKYKDQDDEERELRLRLLGSVKVKEEPVPKGGKATGARGPQKTEKDAKDRVEDAENEEKQEEAVEDENGQQPPPEDGDEGEVSGAEDGEKAPDAAEESDREDAEDRLEEDTELTSSLTKTPLAEDQILFVVPVCAPYSSMQQFKYKVKVTPGTGKRGKAAKMALNLFLKDKTASHGERDLIKALTTDGNVAQNLPGKVRVSAPQMLQAKKK